MTDDHDSQPNDRPATTRRRLLGAAAATGAVASVGALTASGRQRQQEQPDGIDDVYGFAAAEQGTPEPVEADHNVAMEIRPVEGRETPEFAFDPVGLAIDPGDVVRFNSNLGAHTVTAYHPDLERQRRVPDAVPPFSSPLLATGGAYWLYQFDEPGVYDVYCLPHEVFGMVMRVVVGDPSQIPTLTPVGGEPTDGNATAETTETPGAETPASPAETDNGTETGTAAGTPTATPGGGGFELPEFPPTEAAQRVFDDSALTADNILQQGTVAWEDLPASTRGLDGEGTSTPTPEGTPVESPEGTGTSTPEGAPGSPTEEPGTGTPEEEQ